MMIFCFGWSHVAGDTMTSHLNVVSTAAEAERDNVDDGTREDDDDSGEVA